MLRRYDSGHQPGSSENDEGKVRSVDHSRCVHMDPRNKSETEGSFNDLNPILVLVSPKTYNLMTTPDQESG